MLPLRYVSSCYFTSYFLSWTHATPFLYTYSNPPILSHTHTHTPKPPPLHTHMYVNTPFPTCHLLSTHTCTHISSQLSFPRVLSSSHPHRPTIWCQSAGSLTPPRPSSTLEHVALSSPAASLSVWKKIALRLVHRTPMGKCETNTISILPSCLEGGLKTYEPGSLEENRVYPRQWPHFVLKVTSFARKIPQQVGISWGHSLPTWDANVFKQEP